MYGEFFGEESGNWSPGRFSSSKRLKVPIKRHFPLRMVRIHAFIMTTFFALFTHSLLCAQRTKCFPKAGRDGIIHCDHLSIFLKLCTGGKGWYDSLRSAGPKRTLWLGRLWRFRWTRNIELSNCLQKGIVTSLSRYFFDKQNDCCSFPLGQGEAAWLRLHSHLSCLVRKCHSGSLILDTNGTPPPSTLDEKRPKNVVYSRNHRKCWRKTMTEKDKKD